MPDFAALLPRGAHLVALLVEAAGSALLVAYAASAAVRIATVGLLGQAAAARLIAEGAVLALSLKAGASLLRTVDLPDWDAIGRFAAVLALRTVLKRVFAAEAARAGPG